MVHFSLLGWETLSIFSDNQDWAFPFVSAGTTAILSVFAFLFLIPFVVDPAISAITADFDPGKQKQSQVILTALTFVSSEPVTCVVSDHTYSEGIKNCTWSSCREGLWSHKQSDLSCNFIGRFRLHNRTNSMPPAHSQLHKSSLQRLGESARWSWARRLGRRWH